MEQQGFRKLRLALDRGMANNTYQIVYHGGETKMVKNGLADPENGAFTVAEATQFAFGSEPLYRHEYSTAEFKSVLKREVENIRKVNSPYEVGRGDSDWWRQVLDRGPKPMHIKELMQDHRKDFNRYWGSVYVATEGSDTLVILDPNYQGGLPYQTESGERDFLVPVFKKSLFEEDYVSKWWKEFRWGKENSNGGIYGGSLCHSLLVNYGYFGMPVDIRIQYDSKLKFKRFASDKRGAWVTVIRVKFTDEHGNIMK